MSNLGTSSLRERVRRQRRVLFGSSIPGLDRPSKLMQSETENKICKGTRSYSIGELTDKV